MTRVVAVVVLATSAALFACGAPQTMSVVPPPTSWSQQLTLERRQKDVDFASDPDSPIPQKGRAGFRGLAYFPTDPTWRYAGWVERYPVAEKLGWCRLRRCIRPGPNLAAKLLRSAARRC